MIWKIDSHSVLDSTKKVLTLAEHVHINQDKLEAYADSIKIEKINPWILHAPVDISSLSLDQLLSLVLVFSSLSFCYWGDNGTGDYFYMEAGTKHKTSWALLVAICQAHKNGSKILDLTYSAHISDTELNQILNKDIEIPLFKKRCEILRYNASVVSEKFEGSIKKMLTTYDSDINKLLPSLVQLFPSYQDVSSYKGEEIFFLKKTQILIADIARVMEGKEGGVKNIHSLTACADYRLPQLLRHIGVLEYSDELSKTIDSLTLIPAGSLFEVEIRAHTIWSNELIRQSLSKKFNKEFAAIDVNDFLWISAKMISDEMKPYHRTRTVMY